MNTKESEIYVNSIKNDPENQCCYVVDYLIRRDNDLVDHVVLECEEQARPELDAAIAKMPEFFCQMAEMRPHDISGFDSKLMRRVKFLKASRADGKKGIKYSLAVKVYNHMIGKYVTISLNGIPADSLYDAAPFKILFEEAKLYAAGYRGQQSLFDESEDEDLEEEPEGNVLPLHQAS